jgi:hypothetical protein
MTKPVCYSDPFFEAQPSNGSPPSTTPIPPQDPFGI